MPPELVILYAPPQSGKTQLLLTAVERWKALGYRVSGILSPAVFEGEVKTGIRVLDICSGEERPLAQRRKVDDIRDATPGYEFHQDNMAWANDRLLEAVPTEILVIDELGPLELIHHQGWQNGIAVILSGSYKLAVVVVRPSLHDTIRHWSVTGWVEYSALTPASVFDPFLYGGMTNE